MKAKTEDKTKSHMQKLLEKRSAIYTQKKQEAQGLKEVMKTAWDSHNLMFEKKLAEINLDISAENSRGIKKKMKQYIKR